VMEVNFFGAVHIVKASLEALRERRGTIVVTSSIAGLGPLAARCGYSASKHALHGLFNTVRAELEREGVHVMLVCPGFTDTAIEDAALAGSGGRAVRRTVGKLARPEEVAEAVLRGVVSRRRMLVLTPVGKLSHLVLRVAPGLYERLMARRML
ncbi:MAG: SDR family NAD(P)-dependent oxidoreductase, partial [Deltaproteobacteria bacterium]